MTTPAGRRTTGLYICYWSLNDPLCKTQSLAYLERLAAQGLRYSLITFEQQQYALPPRERSETRRRLAAAGICWYPLKYHKRFPLLATAFDCLLGVLVGIFAVLRHRPRVVHSRASIPAAMALAISALCGLKFLYDADSRLSEEYADNGYWSRTSLAFRATAWIEKLARKRADSVVVLTERLKNDFRNELGVNSPIEVIPCCVDLTRFKFDVEARVARRAELGITHEKLLVYVGKSGDRYLVREMFKFFEAAQRLFRARLLILSSEPASVFHQLAESHGLTRDGYCVTRATHAEVAQWLSAADAGLAFIRTAGCERGSSPVKVGEYLATGLPVAITDGIGDYSGIISRERTGVVLSSLSVDGYMEAARRLAALWGEGEQLRARCREVAEHTLSVDATGVPRYQAVYGHLLDRSEGVEARKTSRTRARQEAR